MIHFINIFFSIFLILTICYKVPQEKIELMNSKTRIKNQNSFINSLNSVILLIILIIFGTILFLNRKGLIPKY